MTKYFMVAPGQTVVGGRFIGDSAELQLWRHAHEHQGGEVCPLDLDLGQPEVTLQFSDAKEVDALLDALQRIRAGLERPRSFAIDPRHVT
jgi:hypothetical protein